MLCPDQNEFAGLSDSQQQHTLQGDQPERSAPATGEIVFQQTASVDAGAYLRLSDAPTATDMFDHLVRSQRIQEAIVNGMRRFARGNSPYELRAAAVYRDLPIGVQNYLDRLARGESHESSLRRLLFGGGGVVGLFPYLRRMVTQSRGFESTVLPTAGMIGYQTTSTKASPPQIVVHIGEQGREAFEQRGRSERVRVVRLLRALSRNCRVVIAGSPVDLRWLHETHREEFPTSRVKIGWTGDTTGVDEATISEAAQSLTGLTDDIYASTGYQLLRCLDEVPRTRVSYSTLARKLHCEKANLTYWLKSRETTLRDLDLVETPSVGQQTYVELTPLGAEVLDTLREERQAQTELDAFETDQNSTTNRRETPARSGGGERDGEAESSAVDATPKEGGMSEATPSGLAPVKELSRADAIGAAATATEGEITLLNEDVDAFADYRSPMLWTNATSDRVIVEVEYKNPMTWWVSVARALTHERVLNTVLTADRLADHNEFQSFFDEHRDALRSVRCFGYLPDDLETPSEYLDAIRSGRDDLHDLLTAYSSAADDDEEAELAGELLRLSHGLAGIIAHLLDILGVSLVRVMRLPDFAKQIGCKDQTETRRALCRTLGYGVSVQSTYAASADATVWKHTGYRQQIEHREEKLEWTYDPDVDYEHPYGDLIGSFVLKGDFGAHDVTTADDIESNTVVDRFLEDLNDLVTQPTQYRDDAPEFAIQVPITIYEPTRSDYRQAAAEMLKHKNLRLGSDTVALLAAFTGSPYDVAHALHWLSRESGRRAVRPDEVRYALAQLPIDRIVPHESIGARRLVATLLRADQPLSTTALSNQPTGPSAPTIRRVGDRLKAFGLVTHTDEGNWTLSVPQNRSETSRPAICTADYPREILQSFATDARTHSLSDLSAPPPVEETVSLLPCGLPDLRPILETWPWLRAWMPYIEITTGGQAPDQTYCRTERIATHGTPPEQSSLQQATAGV